MEKKVINYFVDCIKKNKTRILIEKDNKYYISDGACVFIVDKNEMVLNPKLFEANSNKSQIIMDNIKKDSYRELLLKYYIPIKELTYHKYICEDFVIYLDENYIKLFGKFDKVEGIDSNSLVRISIKGHIIGYLLPIRTSENF
ncbi:MULTISPECIES: hypothetical protein [Clostridioides]|uniref:hypothetical protein n=1 Tax=Clostridioides sp. ZZV14-6387 TaxID=2811497 RepID=UPI0007BC3B10|nr:hypothetical protein [Clostridioides sp. ZZV14-6387]CZR95542.1 hypothetical protein CDFC105_60330 [Clostridioides difficile]CZR99885.1 hypothetical protein CDFC105_70075 [Clostridioides difficile]